MASTAGNQPDMVETAFPQALVLKVFVNDNLMQVRL